MPSPKLFTLTTATTLGSFHLIASNKGLRNLYWPNQTFPLKPYYSAKHEQAPGLKPPEFLKATAVQLADFLLGRKVRFTAPLDLSQLTPFARKVLTALSHLPYGRTTTYSQLAKDIGAPAAARAVGSCLARNPFPLIIPCHRVLPRTAAIGGFSAPAGPDLKRHLLSLENIRL